MLKKDIEKTISECGYIDAPIPEGINMRSEIERKKKEKDAVILAHYYQRPEIQEIADYIGDSLALARIAAGLPNRVIVMCGVHFMGETAKILCPDKIVIVPDIKAGCSLADSCPADEFAEFVAAHPDHTVISYVNTSAAVKAHTDIVVTSGNARIIVEQLSAEEKIIFGPDRNLGNYINGVTGRNMLLWNGACHVHEKFSPAAIAELKVKYPEADVLVHPECPKPVRLMADRIGSTAVLLKHAQESDKKTFIVATESGILHEMQRTCPDKKFIPAPPDDNTTCGCNDCAFMKLITMEKLYNSLLYLAPQIHVDDKIAERARRPIERMLKMS